MDGIGVFVPPHILGKYACRGCEDTFIEEIVEVSQTVHVFGGDFYIIQQKKYSVCQENIHKPANGEKSEKAGIYCINRKKNITFAYRIKNIKAWKQIH
ncbi:MAG: hypothetical protein EZS26_000625 [Candidatus Ordinivivax streblomastigis]|uniref:Uncharacterized protein n=1 Tax=Candidatus Ordinivivax streblomastigis TaxID=2540710 RepID=A0A5M8P3V8_9BACT|nr:MAG: hypothetical protein EZS26_000625 [Candidatus Ordinivivax streblomastigis]